MAKKSYIVYVICVLYTGVCYNLISLANVNNIELYLNKKTWNL